MAEYTNYLARKINGPVAQALLRASHAVFNEAEEWLLYRTNISVKTATTEDLNFLGAIVGAPRPYVVTEDNEVVYASDSVYRIYILNIATLKRTRSISALSDMLSQFIPNGLYTITILENGDLDIVVDVLYNEYIPFLKAAIDSIYTALPRLNDIVYRDYHVYIYENGLQTMYIKLDDPSVWDFVYNAHKILTTATEPSRIVMETLSESYSWSWQYDAEDHTVSTVCTEETVISLVADEETQEMEVVIQDPYYANDNQYIVSDDALQTAYLSGTVLGEKTMTMNVVMQEV